MGLLQALAFESLGGYFPGLDLDSQRLNLLRGRLDLKDVDLTPGQIFTVSGFPFRLSSGRIGALSVYLPWPLSYSAHVEINARHIELCFSEIGFANSQPEVFAALQDANRRQKNRILAESERAESAITRALQKFLPILLDRVEVSMAHVNLSLQFADGSAAKFSLSSFETTSAEGIGGRAAKSNGTDLFKTVNAKGISCTLQREGVNLIAVEQSLCCLQLGLRSGVFEVDLTLSEPISVVVHCALASFLRRAKRRVAAWAVAKRHGRPIQSVGENPRAWFQYAVRAVKEREGLTSVKVSLARLQALVPTILEYKHLHVLRLRKNEVLQKAEEDRIAEIEDSLDSEMILLVRRRARSAVMAEEVSAFATRNWLSWALFDYHMSAEREKLAAEIRKSLSVVDQSGREGEGSASSTLSTFDNARGVSRDWWKAKVSVLVKTINIQMKGEVEDAVTLHVGTTSLQAELNSSLETYSLTLSLSELLVSDGDTIIIYRDDDSVPEDSNATVAAPEYFLLAELQKSARERDIQLSLSFAPLRGTVMLRRILTYLQLFMLNTLTVDTSPDLTRIHSTSCGNFDPSPPQPSTELGISVKSRLAVRVSLPQVKLVVSPGLPLEESQTGCGGMLVVARPFQLDMLDTTTGRVCRGSLKAMLRDCDSLQSLALNAHIGSRSEGSVLPGSNPCFQVSGTLDFEVSQSSSILNVKALDASVHVPGLTKWIRTLPPTGNFTKMLVNPSTPHRCTPPVFGDASEVATSVEEHQLIVSKVKVALFAGSGDSGEILGTCENIEGTLSARGASLTVGHVAIEDPANDGAMNFSAESESKSVEGLIIRYHPNSKGDGTSEIELKCGTAAFRLRPQSVSKSVAVVSELRNVFTGWQSATEAKRDDDEPRSGQSGYRGERLSFLAQKVSIEAAIHRNRILLESRNVYIVLHRAVFTGSMDALQLEDLSGFSGRYNFPVQYTPSSLEMQADRRALTFNHSPTFTNVHLYAIRFTLLKAFADRVSALVKGFSDSIETAVAGRRHVQRNPSVTSRRSDAVPYRMFSVQGSDLSLHIPLSEQSTEGMCLETSHLTVTHARDSVTVSARKLSVLTRSIHGNVSVSSSEPGEDGSKVPNWAVLVRALDFDLSKSLKSTTFHEVSTQNRSSWNLHVLSKATFIVAPSQICMLQTIPRLLQNDLLQDTPPETSSPVETDQPAPLSAYEHSSVKITSQVISVELLNEDDGGSVESTIACLELGPIEFSLRQAHEEAQCGRRSIVTRWLATAPSIRLEDSNSGTPQFRRDVVRSNGGETMGPFSSNKSLGVADASSVVSIEWISRNDENGGYRSSLEIKLRQIGVVLVGSYIGRLLSFGQSVAGLDRHVPEDPRALQTSSRTAHGGGSARTGVSRPSDEKKLEEFSSESCSDEAVALKVSVKIVNSFVQLSGRSRRGLESSVFVHFNSLKSVMLLADSGCLLPGSQVRVEEAAISMAVLPVAVVRSEQNVVDVAQRRRPHGDETGALWRSFSQSYGNATVSSGSGQRSKSDLSFPGERLLWNVFRQSKDTSSSEDIGVVRGLVLKLPAKGQDRFVCFISAVALDLPVRRLLKFAYLLSVLDILPVFGTESQLRVSPILVSLQSFSARISVPTVTDEFVKRQLFKPKTALRVRLTVKLHIGRDLSGVSGNVLLSADAFDQRRGIRDQLLSSCAAQCEVVLGKSISVSIVASRLIRFVLSPLTGRVLSGLAAELSTKSAASRSSGTNLATNRSETPDHNALSVFKDVSFSVSLRCLAVCCVAENPRVQMMRLSLRELRAKALYPLLPYGKGFLDLSLRDVLLEDTFSWRFGSDQHLENERIPWSVILSRTEVTQGLSAAEEHSSTTSRELNSASQNGDLLRRIWNQGFMRRGQINGHALSSREDRTHVFQCRLSWRSPFDQVTGAVQIGPLELRANLGVFPQLTSWMESVSHASSEVHTASQNALPSSVLSSDGLAHRAERDFHVGIDHLVLAPIQLTVSAKSPTRRIRESAALRFLSWLLGSETSIGTTITLPRVAFNGDFGNFLDVLHRIRTIYVAAMASKDVGLQLISQAPGLSRLMRVFVMSTLRRRPAIGENAHGPRSPAVKVGLLLARGHSAGLEGAFSTQSIGILTQFRVPRIKGPHEVAAKSTDEPDHEDNAQRLIETLDLTGNSKSYGEESYSLDGRTLFRWLRRNDERIPNNDSFELHAPFSVAQSLIITSTFLLFIQRASRRIEKPIIRRDSIAEYHLTGQRITIVSVLQSHRVPARSAARQLSRDTSSLAKEVNKGRAISEIITHEIECSSPQYASWLRSQLPATSINLAEDVT